tara:strand:- start:49 stop:525 length:477 start_codon:yes stop_codon:yes gene_type:complete
MNFRRRAPNYSLRDQEQPAPVTGNAITSRLEDAIAEEVVGEITRIAHNIRPDADNRFTPDDDYIVGVDIVNSGSGLSIDDIVSTQTAYEMALSMSGVNVEEIPSIMENMIPQTVTGERLDQLAGQNIVTGCLGAFDNHLKTCVPKEVCFTYKNEDILL